MLKLRPVKRGRVFKSAAFTLLVLMFLPQMQGFDQYLPSLVGSYATSAQTSSNVLLPPGTVYDPNMLNEQTMSTSCPSKLSPSSNSAGGGGSNSSTSSSYSSSSLSSSSNQPLELISGSWSASAKIPTLLLMGKPVGGYVEQNYTVSNNGLVTIVDSTGNSFNGFTMMIDGAPVNIMSNTLEGNSSEAIQNFTVSSLLVPNATISITYSIAHQFCQPSGLSVSFAGNLGLPSTLRDQTFGIKFLSSPYGVTGTSSWFQKSNATSTRIGFDWSDSLAYSPQFDSATNSLSWKVNSSFSIDPELVANSDVQQFGEYDHLLWYSQNLWWLFYVGQHSCSPTCTYSLNYSTSSNGIQWTNWGSITTLPSVSGSQPRVDIAVSGSSVFYAEDYNAGTSFYWGYGALLTNGAIQWSVTQSSVTLSNSTYAGDNSPSVAFDTSGRPWAVIPEFTTIVDIKNQQYYECKCYSEVFAYSTATGTMQSSHQFIDAGISGSLIGSSSQLLGLSNGEISLVTCELCYPDTYSPQSGSYINATYTSGQGSSWYTSQVKIASSSNNEPVAFAADTLGSTVYVAYDNYSSSSQFVNVASLNYGSTSANAIVTVEKIPNAPILGITMTKDGNGNLAITLADPNTNANGDPSANTVRVYKSTSSGANWAVFETLSWNANFNSNAYAYTITQTPSISGSGLTGIAWEQGISLTKNIEFASFPIVTPNPSVFSNSWSRPGNSPYESYFSHIDDSISPGNGLLTLEQTDLSLPGRNGLDLLISRVYEEPFAFGPANGSSNYTAGYDNFTLGNVGLGWQLNFPWMGNNYLHMADGQAYVYQWNSSGVFENHAGTDFVMYHWSNNNTYDLYMANGLRYHFFSNQSLAYETDPTGNNTINFYYSNKQISSIVDTVGRTVSFSYNLAGEVSSISSGGIQYSYGYNSIGDLMNVTDSLGRVTKYAYSGNWLMTNVTYPTGGQTIFTYGKETVGTEDSSYFVTLAAQYTSPNVLDESNSYSYVATNGVISFANETTANQSGKVQSYDIYQFPSGANMYLVPVTLTNSQASAVTSGTQIMINVNWNNYRSLLAPNLQNVEFVDTNNVPIYAWCESSCSNSSTSSNVWLKLDQAIPPGQSITIYLGIGSLSINNFANGFWGECATCSPYYGQYDNGAAVFNFYDNFAGSNLSSSKWQAQVGSLSYTVDNGLTITNAGANWGDYTANMLPLNYSVPSSYAVEWKQTISDTSTSQMGDGGIQGDNSGTTEVYADQSDAWGQQLWWYAEAFGNSGSFTNVASGWSGAGTNKISTSAPDGVSTRTFGMVVTNGNLYYYDSYNLLGQTSFSQTVNRLAIQAYSYSGYPYLNGVTFSYVRVRTPPPNNVMPSASFGTLQAAGKYNSPSTVYVPITLSNWESSAVTSGTQVLVNVDWQNYEPYLATKLQNVEFFDSSQNPLYAWCESGCTNTSASSNVWVKLDQSIPAGQSSTINLGIESISNNNMSPTGYWGEYPTATSTYAQYDNGAKVFNFYDNFGGSSLSSSWTVTGLTYSVNNGFTASAASGSIAELITDSAQVNAGNAIDYFGSIYQSGNNWVEVGAITSSSSNNVGSFVQSYSDSTWGQQQNTLNYARSGNLATSQITGVWSAEFESSSTSNYQLNYGNVYFVSSDAPSYPSYFGLRLASATLSPSVSIQWIRSRILPPNDVMPQVSFGQPPSQSSHTILDANRDRLRTDVTTYDSFGHPIETQEFATTPSSIKVDGTASAYSALASSVTASLSTSNSNDVIVAYCETGNYGTTVSVSGGGLTWNTRVDTYKISQSGNNFAQMYEAYAIASNPLSSAQITCSLGTTDSLSLIVFGVSGANTTSPFDTNPVLPAKDQGDSSSPSVSVSTSNANDMIFGFLIRQSSHADSVGSGFTSISDGVGKYQLGSVEYQVAYSAQSNLVVSYSMSGTQIWGMIGDAIVQASSSSNPSVLLYTTYTSYDNWGNVISTTDAIGHTTYYSYANTNSYNTFIGAGSSFTNSFYTNNTVISPFIHDALVGEAELQNGAGSSQMETYYDYNAAGEMLDQKELYINGTTDTWLYTSHTYDSYGNVLTSIDPLGRTKTYQYSSTYNHAYLTNQSIVVSGKTISTTYAYNFTTGWMTSQTNGNGQTTSYTYDNLGRETSVTYPAVGGVSALTQYSYDDKNNIVNITDPNGNLVRQYFDGLGRQIEVQTFNGSLSYSTEYYTYNYQNQVANHTTPTGQKYSYYYDALGRQIELINPDGTKEFTSYDTVLNSTMYDVVQTNENGFSTYNYYNWNNELLSVQQPPTSGIKYITKYTYDQVGNLLTTTDANNHVTAYQYDNLNRLIMTKYPDGTNSTNTYDAVGNLIKTKDPIGNVITNTYDALNRLTQVKYPNSATVSYTYDADGNMLSMIQSSPSTSSYYSYDARDRLTNETDVIDGASYTTLFSYDKASNILSITYPDNTSLSFTYDSLNRIKTVGAIANFTYTLDSKIATIGYGNNVKTTYTYDSRDRPKSIYSFSGSTQLMGLNYTYDGVGNVLSINTESYSYNSLNELISSSGGWGSTSYFYDGAGNMLNMTSGSTTTKYGYDSYNRMTSAGSATLTYDANGNLNKIVNGTNTWKYYYNYENELTSVTKNGATVQNNTYSGDGNRVEQVFGSSNIVYTYQGLNILYEKNLTNSIVTKHYYANGLQLGENYGSSMYYFLEDAMGNVRDVTTASPVTSVFTSDYKPYGINYGLSESLSIFNFEYTDKPYDSATGLYYFGSRFYDPEIERFVTEDSTKGSLENPITLNRYAYANDNPLTIIDPSGNSGWWSSITNAVASVASAVSSTLTSAATTVTNAWNSLPPQDQAIAVTAGIDVAAGLAVTADALTIGAATPLVDPLVGAAISSTIYTATTGRSARWQGAIGAAAAGAVTFGVGSAVAGALAEGSMSAITAVSFNEGAAVGGNLLETEITAGLSGKVPRFDLTELGVDMAFAAIPGLGDTPGATQMEPAISLGDYGNLYAASANFPRAVLEQGISSIGSYLVNRYAGPYIGDVGLT